MKELIELKEEHLGDVKMRIYIEFQYAESFNFFTLFKRFERKKDSLTGKQGSMFCAVQYSDYAIPKGSRSN